MAAEIGGHLSHSPKEMWILGFVCHVFTILALGFVGLGVGCLMVGAVSSFEKNSFIPRHSRSGMTSWSGLFPFHQLFHLAFCVIFFSVLGCFGGASK